MLHVETIIQARMGSSRLPGKVLADIEGRAMLERCAGRAALSRLSGGIAIATTTLEEDLAIDRFCSHRGWRCWRGREVHVLRRYLDAAHWLGADVIVRISADCPLIDPDLIDDTIKRFTDLAPNVDYVGTIGYPLGLDVEVFSLETLRKANAEAIEAGHREHVTPYMYESDSRFRTAWIHHQPDLSEFRWTVDEEPDLRFVREIFRRMGRDHFSYRDVLALLEREPDLVKINQHVRQKPTH
jgi:spore coat polysaccharide biosynthesis protein SpsF